MSTDVTVMHPGRLEPTSRTVDYPPQVRHLHHQPVNLVHHHLHDAGPT